MFLTTLMVSRSTSSAGLMDCSLEESNSLGLYGYRINVLDISHQTGYFSLSIGHVVTTKEHIKTTLPTMWRNRVFAQYEGVRDLNGADIILVPCLDLLSSNTLGLDGYLLNETIPEKYWGSKRYYFSNLSRLI